MSPSTFRPLRYLSMQVGESETRIGQIFFVMRVRLNSLMPFLSILPLCIDTDMNAELIAHGLSNTLSGLFGGEFSGGCNRRIQRYATSSHGVHHGLLGLQNYLCYSNSILYAKCGGEGKASSLAVAIISTVLFFVGPHIASYIPRCMAGTLLLHIGIDLVLEGVLDCKCRVACCRLKVLTFV